jgi:hypothetical protein
MQPQNHSRPAPTSRRKTSRRAMGEEGGESFDHLVAKICKPGQNRNNRNNFRKFCFRTNPYISDARRLLPEPGYAAAGPVSPPPGPAAFLQSAT